MKSWKPYALILMTIVTFGCSGPSKAELAKIQSSRHEMAEALVNAYRGNNEKLFTKLVLPYDELKTFMNAQVLPPGADVTQKLEAKKAEFEEKVLATFRTVMESEALQSGEVAVDGIDILNAVPMGGDYKVEMLQLGIEAAKKSFTQSVTLITTPDGRFWFADIFPLVEKE